MLLSVGCFFNFMGVSREFSVVITLAVRMAPHLVRVSAHATRRNFGEVECSLIHFLAMAGGSKGAEREDGHQVLVAGNKRLPDLEISATSRNSPIVEMYFIL